MEPVDEKPRRKYRTGSKYDLILNAFMEGEANLVEVSVEDKEANYLRLQLSKRIDARARARRIPGEGVGATRHGE